MSIKDSKSHGFLIKTYNLLEDETHKDIIDWTPQGNGFVIYDIDKLETQVLPSYFKHSNFQSFVRQLNMYGFHKIRSAKDTNYYTHQYFIKGQRQKIKLIVRKTERKMIKKIMNLEQKVQKETKPYLNSLALVLKANSSLLQQQTLLIQLLKRQWDHTHKRMVVNENKQSTIENNIRYRIEQQKTQKSLDTYWQMQQQMFSKLYMQSVSLLNKEDGMPQTHTSISKL